MENGLNEKLNRVTTAFSEMKNNLGLDANTPIEEIAAQTNLRSLLNIYLQEEEPSTKDGLWLQSSDLSMEHLIVDDNMMINEEWIDTAFIRSAWDSDNTQYTSTAIIGDYLYMVCRSTTTITPMVKINLKDQSFETLSKPPIALGGKEALVNGTDIYFIGNRTQTQTATRAKFVKFDTLSNTFTELTDVPYRTSYMAKFCVYNNCIYGFNLGDSTTSGSSGYQYRYTCKYDIATGVWSNLPDYPHYYVSACDVVVLGDKVWFLYTVDYTSSTTSTITNSAYKKTKVFDLTTEQYLNTNLTLPYAKASSTNDKPRAKKVGDYVYIFEATEIIKVPISAFYIRESTAALNYSSYDIIQYPNGLDGTGTKQLFTLSISTNEEGIIITTTNATHWLSLTTKSYPNNSIIIKQGLASSNAYQVQLFKVDGMTEMGKLVWPVCDIRHYTAEDKINKTVPTYYGNGTEWIRFKN